ncbi:MAG: sulfatase-like hydrolase/transferase [Verrucomicrobiota bacterium]
MSGRRDFIKSAGMTVASLAVGGAKPMEATKDNGGVGSSPIRRPNIILIVSDEHQAKTCGCYGSEVKRVDGLSPTPHIDALASEGVRFDSMYCASPLCAPSRAAYMTGTYPHTTTALHHKMQNSEAGLSRYPGVLEGIPGMGSYLKGAGYRTAAYGKMHVHGEEVDGWDLGFEERGLRFYTRFPGKHYADLKGGDVNKRYREMSPYLDSKYRDIDSRRFAHAPEDLTVRQNGLNEYYLETLVEFEDEMVDELITDRSIEFMEKNAAGGEPFFVHVGLEKPHRPWTIHQKFLDRFDPRTMPLPSTIGEWKEKGFLPFVQSWCHTSVEGDEARNSTAAYYACASAVDDCVGRIMNKCRELDILENTVVIYTSDHGESLYEHGLIEKHNMLDPSARVPFIIRAPWAVPKGEVRNDPASLIDMIPTFCDLSGAEGSPLFEGESLISLIERKQDPERMVFSEFYQSGSVSNPTEFLPVRMGLNRKRKYIYTHAAADQLYDRLNGGEAHLKNLAFDEANEAEVSKLKLCTLDAWELDEYPQLKSEARVSANGVSLFWEDAGFGATYDIYRATESDPRGADRIASGLSSYFYADESARGGEKYFYWVLAHYAVSLPFADSRGKSRFGKEKIKVDGFPRALPLSPRMEVEVLAGFEETFAYEPLLGCSFDGLDWIYIGMPPRKLTQGAVLEGPVSVLTPYPVSDRCVFEAEMQTAKPGPGDRDVLRMVLRYLNMRQCYYVELDRKGSLSLWKRTGEWSQDLLKAVDLDDAWPDESQLIRVETDSGQIAVFLGDRQMISVADAEPYLGGRCGFEAPRYLRDGYLRKVRIVS